MGGGRRGIGGEMQIENDLLVETVDIISKYGENLT